MANSLTPTALNPSECALIQVALDILTNKLAIRQKVVRRRHDDVMEQKLLQQADTIRELHHKLIHIQARTTRRNQAQVVAEWIAEVGHA